MSQTYVMALCQPPTQTVFGPGGVFVPEHLEANLAQYEALIERAAREHDAKLIVFPQFGLSGYAPGLTVDQWIAASLTFPGAHVQRLGRAAKAAGAHVVVQAAEAHRAFPGRYFLSAGLLRPDGNLGLAYRKHYSISTRTSPADVYDEFIATFGVEGLFPVADTPLGRIGIVIGAEVNWPETVRSLALKGAEIILNPVATAPLIDYMGRAGASSVRAARAFENIVYLGMANMGLHVPAHGASEVAIDPPPPSQIYDFEGELIATAGAGPGQFALARIDIRALRQARARPAANFIAQIQPHIHTYP